MPSSPRVDLAPTIATDLPGLRRFRTTRLVEPCLREPVRRSMPFQVKSTRRAKPSSTRRDMPAHVVPLPRIATGRSHPIESDKLSHVVRCQRDPRATSDADPRPSARDEPCLFGSARQIEPHPATRARQVESQSFHPARPTTSSDRCSARRDLSTHAVTVPVRATNRAHPPRAPATIDADPRLSARDKSCNAIRPRARTTGQSPSIPVRCDESSTRRVDRSDEAKQEPSLRDLWASAPRS